MELMLWISRLLGTGTRIKVADRVKSGLWLLGPSFQNTAVLESAIPFVPSGIFNALNKESKLNRRAFDLVRLNLLQQIITRVLINIKIQIPSWRPLPGRNEE